MNTHAEIRAELESATPGPADEKNQNIANKTTARWLVERAKR